MSSEDPGTQDQPPSGAGSGEGDNDTAPYGYSSPGSADPYGVPTGGATAYGAPAGGENPYGQPAEQSPGAHGTYGQNPYGAPPYQQPTYQQPSGYPPPQQWGQPQQPGYPYGPGGPGYPGQPPQENDGLALGAMIVGIVALVLSCGYGVGLLASPVALVMGRVSMKRIDRSGGRLAGRGMALTGFILGIIGTVLLVLAIIAVVILIVVAVNGGFDSNTTPPGVRYNS